MVFFVRILGFLHGDLQRMYVRVVEVPSLALTCQKVFEKKLIAFFVETIDVESSGIWHDCNFKVT